MFVNTAGYNTQNVPLTQLQKEVQEWVKKGESVLLVAPTGIGKTLAVSANLAERRTRTVYGVPLRALAAGILKEIRNLRANPEIDAVVHHGDAQGSRLFSEEFVITTYDQIVCATPGLPLSLPLSAGHAIAGALLMSGLILDEAHLAWGISKQALEILFGIVRFRRDLGLQTVLMTGTLPKQVAERIAGDLNLHLIFAGDEATKNDEALAARALNRRVRISKIEIKAHKQDKNRSELAQVVEVVTNHNGKVIYFANTVDRIQQVYDILEQSNVDMARVTVLHNRMPRSWRNSMEAQVGEKFGKGSSDGQFILLTNQVAEAGLDISASLVISDPAPVDTLVQRAGRCARWFRSQVALGEFKVIAPAKKAIEEIWRHPYRSELVQLSLEKMERNAVLDWDHETKWLNAAWGGKNATESVEQALNSAEFALNLFDRAAQQQSPGAIASVFREILSVQVAIVDEVDKQHETILAKMRSGYEFDSSSISLNRAYSLLRGSKGHVRVIRYRDDELAIEKPFYFTSGDLLLLPPSLGYLHRDKGLCFGDSALNPNSISVSELILKPVSPNRESHKSRRQGLWEHTKEVIDGVEKRFLSEGDYRAALLKILRSLESDGKAEELLNAIARLAMLATGFHDLGKCDLRWQRRAREIDPSCPPGLIGRTSNTVKRIGIPHTPPGFFAAAAACEIAIGGIAEGRHLARAIALAAARHHSSLLNPSAGAYPFEPADGSAEFVKQVLEYLGIPYEEEILRAAGRRGTSAEVPSMLPNDDLFPVYALIGRAILMSDRESASGNPLEQWSTG